MAKITVTLVESTTKEIEVSGTVYRAAIREKSEDIIALYKADYDQDKMVGVYPYTCSIGKLSFLENILFGANTVDIEPHQFYEAYAKVMLQIESFVGLERLELKDAQDGPY